MSILDAIILGLVQGLTEFIPVSSSGHLILASELFGLNSSFEFDVLLNIGTILALTWYFRRRLADLIKEAFGAQNKLALALLIATVPAVIIGGMFTDFFDQDWARSSQTVGVMLIAVGLVIVVMERWATTDKKLETASTADALTIGLFQAMALIPGTSRSGITMIAGRLRGFNYKTAAEFSFLLGLPVLTGAVLRVLLDEEGQNFVSEHTAEFIIGNLASFASGLWAVSFMIGWLSKHGLKPFGWYRIGLGLIVLIVTL